ncbi:hypothetical protein AB4Z52_13695 [Rhizobium sp. 2YAF20]|uniref:hypothetical protein n=1 Tax=Rhizobium sp. 2YAF20 TaxID=3233027 RepID=UPI003F9E7659
MSDKLIPIRDAADIIGCDFYALIRVIEYGDLMPAGMPADLDPRKKFWSRHLDDIRFSPEDIERFRYEINHRRKHVDFIQDYADILDFDTGPGSRTLEQGPGWDRLLCELGDGLRVLQRPDWRPKLYFSKEKFGCMQAHVSDFDRERRLPLDMLIERIRRKSLRTCEECGEPGRLRWGSFLKTTCDRHAFVVGTLREEDGKILDARMWRLGEDGKIEIVNRKRWSDEELGL